MLPVLWDDPVRVADSYTKHDAEFGESAARLSTNGKVRLAIAGAEVRDSFQALAKELEKEIRTHASRDARAVPAQSGARARSGR
jgi:hypothetical protein